MTHIILLGDSIFDNKSYVGDAPDVISHLRSLAEPDTRATLLAVDGSRAHDVPEQAARIPDDATHLFLSVGGNDALYEADILNMPCRSSAEVFSELSDRAAAFESRYERALEAVLEPGLPTAICTIYYPRFEDPMAQKIAVAALASFNDVIIRQAFSRELPLIDLRLTCSEYEDYANDIEPSDQGGRKIAEAIIKMTKEHDFGAMSTN
ncbi:MAG: SGNH/GDSL hydrolase family protein [Acidobacteriota bacterium]|nr:MAG: SGNH/GDSL hydrolase family protein [Acidobacteriota bacterium]